MTTAQKIIKYLALAFAAFLIINIISACLFGFYALANIFGLKKENKIENAEMITTNFGNKNINKLDIEVAYTNLIIKKGETLKIDTNSKYINCKQDGKELKIEEENRNWFSKNNEGDLIVYIPENIELEKIKIGAGAGKIEAEQLSADKLTLEIGAGEVKIENLNIKEDAEIEGGAGKVEVLNGVINNLDLDMGVGEAKLTTSLQGNSKINAGIGNLKINLNDDKEDYKIKANKGIGSIKIDGKQISNDETYGDGDNYIKLDGGIGNIEIDFK